jgi:hypothetical protein
MEIRGCRVEQEDVEFEIIGVGYAPPLSLQHLHPFVWILHLVQMNITMPFLPLSLFLSNWKNHGQRVQLSSIPFPEVTYFLLYLKFIVKLQT